MFLKKNSQVGVVARIPNINEEEMTIVLEGH